LLEVLSQKHDKEEEEESWELLDFLLDCLQDANALDICLNTMIAACYALAWILIFDVNLPPKEVPGHEITNFMMLTNAVSLAALLAICWTAAGIFARSFCSWSSFDPRTSLLTMAVVGALWLSTKHSLHLWLPPAAPGAPNLVTTIWMGSIGIFGSMSLSQAATDGWQ
jgi:hypothetical protein